MKNNTKRPPVVGGHTMLDLVRALPKGGPGPVMTNRKNVPAGREPGPDFTKPACDAVMEVEMRTPVDDPVTPSVGNRPVIYTTPLPHRGPPGEKREQPHVGMRRRTQGSDPRAI